MVERLDVGGLRFVVTYGQGAHTIERAYIYINSPGMPFYQYWLKGYTDAYGVLNISNLPTGTNKYIVSKPGYNSKSGSIVVIGGVSITVSVDLIPSLSLGTVMVGNLDIVSNPPGACIYIDDVVQNAVTPVSIAEVPEGDHLLILTKDGYADYNTLATVESGRTTTISANLEPV